MAGRNDRDQRERMLHTIHRQIEYLRTYPETRPRVIGRLEALCRLARINAQAEKPSRLGQLSVTLQHALPGQIALLRSDTNNDGKVADALVRMAHGESLLVRCPYEEREADKPEEFVEEISFTEEDGRQDEHDLTPIVFGIQPARGGL